MENKVVAVVPRQDKLLQTHIEKIMRNHGKLVYRVFLGFPLFYPGEESFRPVALAITQVGLFFLTESQKRKDDEFVFLEGQLKKHPFLRSGTNLRFRIKAIVYDKEGVFGNEMENFFGEGKGLDLLGRDDMRYIESALTGMLPQKEQQLVEGASAGSDVLKAIKRINHSIRVFDEKQYQAIEGRSGRRITSIRGLAGCGKTIVLSKIATNEIIQTPNARICYTYQTRSMYSQVSNQIRSFLIASGVKEYESFLKRVEIMGAWGGYDNPGLLNTICHEFEIRPLSLEEARGYNFYYPFSFYCDYVADSIKNKKTEMYDCLLVDEAQDFDPSFLRLCLSVLKPNGQLIYAYDDFQTLTETSLPDPSKIFGKGIQFETKILDTCYRTPPQTLVLAHAIAMGLYSSTGKILQFPENAEDWTALGYCFEQGTGKVGEKTVISRKTPSVFDGIEGINAVSFRDTSGDQLLNYEELASFILTDLKEGLEPDDLLIIDLDGAKLTEHFSLLLSAMQNALPQEDDCSLLYLAGSLSPDRFRQPGRITFSGVKRAKGNEAYKVYVLNAHFAMNEDYPILWRNRLFTAMTRTRLQLVMVCPAGSPLTQKLKIEINAAVKKGNYRLEFKYPSKDAIKKIISKAKNEIRIAGESENMAREIGEIDKRTNGAKLDVLESALRSQLSEDELKLLIEALQGKKDPS